VSQLTPEEGKALIEKLRALRAEQRARGEIETPPSPAAQLEVLEQDARAGRTIKHDYRLSPEEKARLYEAAQALGLTASEFVRDVVARACDEILAVEPVGAEQTF